MAAGGDRFTSVTVGLGGALGRRPVGAPFFAGKVDRRRFFLLGGRGAVLRCGRGGRRSLGPFVVEFGRQAVAVGLQVLRGALGLGQRNTAVPPPGRVAQEQRSPCQLATIYLLSMLRSRYAGLWGAWLGTGL
jgi:hypothetical protein